MTADAPAAAWKGPVLRELGAGLAVALLAVPQAMAYAVVAGLPPVTGLYATMLPLLVATLARSQPVVIAGPSNAVSMTVGSALAGLSGKRAGPAALAMALVVGLVQLLAGLLRLGRLLDYVSSAVVTGTIAGAGLLIVRRQAAVLLGEPAGLWLGAGTGLALVLLRRCSRRLPAPLVALAAATLLARALGLQLRTAGELSAIPRGLPALTRPPLEMARALLPGAMAVATMAVLESSSVAREIARRSGRALDVDREFRALGLANLAAAFTGGYPVSGSPARTWLAWASGARGRWCGVLAALLVTGIVAAFGPIAEAVPLSALAGMLVVVGLRMVDPRRILALVRADPADGLAFGVTLGSTFLVPLDQAIFFGILVSLVLFIRRASTVHVREIAFEPGGVPSMDGADLELRRCEHVALVQLEGELFFGAAGQLREKIEPWLVERRPRVLVLRLSRSRALDLTCAEILVEAARRMRAAGGTLMLTGLDDGMMQVLHRVPGSVFIGSANLFDSRPGLLASVRAALHDALEITGPHRPDCPIRAFLDRAGS